MLRESPREIVLPGAHGHCAESTGPYCEGMTRIDLATKAARVICPFVAYGGCGAPNAEAPAVVMPNSSEVQ